MTTKVKVAVCAASLALAFASGRYLTPAKVVTEVKTVEVEKKVKDTESDTNRHKQTQITEKVKPDGTKETTTTVTEDTTRKTDSKETDIDKKSSDSKTETTRPSGRTTLSALAGTSLSSPGRITYGAIATTSLVGPLSGSVWALQSGVCGVGIGLTF